MDDFDVEKYRRAWDDHVDQAYVNRLLAEAHERDGARWDIGTLLDENYDRDRRPALRLRPLDV